MNKSSFNHSVKVPKLYKCAAKIFEEVSGGAGSLKNLVYEKTHFNTKALYALVATALQKSKELDLLLKRTKLLENEPRFNQPLARILISELLWGKNQLPNSAAKPIVTILAYEQAFRAHLSDSSSNKDSRPVCSTKPRYIRINTLVTSLNEALSLFEEEGWNLLPQAKTYKTFLDQVSSLEENNFLKDFHVPELLVFPSGTQFYNHPGYKKGAIILQDKASCLPVRILAPEPGSVVLDMCAAPGMKTTQIGATLGNEGTVYACEMDAKRFQVLKTMIENTGCSCAKPINKDVLQCGSTDFPDVDYVIVDPSCSGSGMTDRLEIGRKEDPLRMQKLAGFQIKILRSALTRFPKAKRVVYSTCSLYAEENEDVVRQVLETNNEFKLVDVKKFVGDEWLNFGSEDFGNIGKYCLYARPDVDLTNGFFLAVLERLDEGERNEFFNERVISYRKHIEQRDSRKERRQKRKSDNIGEEQTNIRKNKENRKRTENVVNIEVEEQRADNSEQSGGIENVNGFAGEASPKRKKKRKDSGDNGAVISEILDNDEGVAVTEKKKKRRKRDIKEEERPGSENLHLGTTTNLDEGLKRKKKKRDKSRAAEEVEAEDEVLKRTSNENEIGCNDIETPTYGDKKLKHKKGEEVIVEEKSQKKRKKNKKSNNIIEESVSFNNKKSCSENGETIENLNDSERQSNDEECVKRKKRKKDRGEDIERDVGEENVLPKMKHKKNKTKSVESSESSNTVGESISQ